MRKLFFAICFIYCLASNVAYSGVSQMMDAAESMKQPKEIVLPAATGMPNPDNLEEVINFFRKRFQTVSVSSAEDLGDLNKSNTMDVQHSKEYIDQMQEQKKSTFEKIYDEAMSRISGETPQNQNSAPTVFYTEATPKNTENAEEVFAPDVPVINVNLPTGNQIIAPAMEHIPYMLTTINILPTGLIQIDEEITVVANKQKLTDGIVKIIPKFTKSRAKVKKKLDIELLNVSVNQENIPHILEEIGDKIYIKPQQKYTLAPGVYNYKFSYLLDRKLWYYDDFTEFYWDITGSYLNLVITSANAIVSIPDGKKFISQNAIIGRKGKLFDNRAIIANLDSNALGFASTTPLLPGEGMHILVSLDKNTFLPPDINRNFVWFITDYGDILFSVAGLLAIIISYALSWNFIKKNKSKTNYIKTNAPIMRYLLKNTFDSKSFGSYLIELRRKQYIDIEKQGETIMLIKKTDNLSKLSKYEKKALNNLFLGKESVISATSPNVLKFKRAFAILEKGIKSSIKKITLKINIGYLAFSIGMLILSIIAISALGINSLQTFAVLLSACMTISFYTYMIKRKFSSKILGYIIKFFGAVFIVFSIFLMSVYIHLISALFIALSIVAIFEYSLLFSKKSGLLKNKIKEFEKLKSYLTSNVLTIINSQEFVNQQANIHALELDNLYEKNEYNKKSYTLDVIKQVENLMV